MRVLKVLAVCMLLGAVPAAGQGIEGSIELTPTVGFWFGDTLTQGVTDAFGFDVTIDDSPAYGLRVAYRFTRNWSLEGSMFRQRADLVTGRRELFGGQAKLGTIDLTSAQIGFEGGFGRSRVVPFLAGGIGAMNLSPNIENLSGDTRFMANFGGGLKFFFTPEVALRFDWRGHSVKVGDSRYSCDWWGDCTYDGWISFTEVGLGMQFSF